MLRLLVLLAACRRGADGADSPADTDLTSPDDTARIDTGRTDTETETTDTDSGGTTPEDTGPPPDGTYTVVREVTRDDAVDQWCRLVWAADVTRLDPAEGACVGCEFTFDVAFSLTTHEDEDGSCAYVDLPMPPDGGDLLLSFDADDATVWSYAMDDRRWEYWAGVVSATVDHAETWRADARSYTEQVTLGDEGIVITWTDYLTYQSYARLAF
jgi:hypothetical protein